MTHMQDRHLLARISSLKSHILLLGPRQVGKSTLVRSLNPQRYINLAFEGEYLSYAKDPFRLPNEIRALREQSTIVVDEVQRIPSLLNSLQALIDDNPLGHRYCLTGSSARRLKRGGANLLPGRIISLHLDPLLRSELGTKFSLLRALTVGCLPGIFLNEKEGSLLLKSYVDTYLREEIQAEGLLDNIGGFARLLDAIAVVSGQWLNYSKLSSDIEVSKETVRRYIKIMEDTLVLHRVGSFKPKLKISRRVSQRDKVLLFDIGVRNALLGIQSNLLPPTLLGPIFEHWFILELIGMNRAFEKGWSISSYLTHDGQEVDLVIETDSKIIGIEIKSGHTIRSSALSGLKSLGELVKGYKKYEPYLVYQGQHEQLLETEIRAVPYEQFLDKIILE
jgi:uncharacterized protein